MCKRESTIAFGVHICQQCLTLTVVVDARPGRVSVYVDDWLASNWAGVFALAGGHER